MIKCSNTSHYTFLHVKINNKLTKYLELVDNNTFTIN